MQKISIIGLVIAVIPKREPIIAASSVSVVISSSIILVPTLPMLSPEPARPVVIKPCSDTESAYNRTGTIENKLTAIKPLIAFKAVC